MVAQVFATSGGGGGGGTTDPDLTPYQGSVTTVPPDAETTVVSHIAAAAFRLYGVVVTGTTEAEWVVYDDATEVFRSRTSPAERGKDLLEGRGNAIVFASGHTVAVKVRHHNSDVVGGTATRDFWATLLAKES